MTKARMSGRQMRSRPRSNPIRFPGNLTHTRRDNTVVKFEFLLQASTEGTPLLPGPGSWPARTPAALDPPPAIPGTVTLTDPEHIAAGLAQSRPQAASLNQNSNSKYPTPIGTLGKDYLQQLLTEREASEKVGSLNISALHERLMRRWRLLFEQTLIDTKSPGYLSWLSHFIKTDVHYGTVHAWAKAVIQSPNRFLSPGGPSSFTLLPEWFDNFGEVSEVCNVGGEPELDREGNIIVRDDINCVRRVWDVCANQVIPRCWVPQAPVEPISHSWVHPKELQYKWTPVNNMLWPLPIPHGIELETVRQELVKYGIEYTWLDVLCLRQIIPLEHAQDVITRDVIEKREKRRLKEWGVDVPLIGALYATGQGRVLVYLNGLGKPYDPAADWTNERHWLSRAWTLQETVAPCRMAIGGLQEGITHPLNAVLEGTELGKLAKELYELASETDILSLVRRMSVRSASNPVDKISGLFFVFLGPRGHHLNGKEVRFPKYSESLDPEEAWKRLVHALADGDLEKLSSDSITYLILKNFPHPSQNHWFPSWSQVVNWPTVSIQEVQREDQQPPKIDRSLRLRSGCILFNCQLSKRQGSSSDPNLIDTLSYSVSVVDSYSGVPFRILSWWLKPFVKTDTVPAVAETGNYVIIHLRKTAAMTGGRTEGLGIICRDISRFRPHQGSNPRIYLRRVTTLQVYENESSGCELDETGNIERVIQRGEDIANFRGGTAIYLE